MGTGKGRFREETSDLDMSVRRLVPKKLNRSKIGQVGEARRGGLDVELEKNVV